MARESQRIYVLTLCLKEVILVHSDMLGRMKSKKCPSEHP